MSVFHLFIGVMAKVDPTFRNIASELSTFGAFKKVNPTRVKWKGLDLVEFDVNFGK